MFKRKSVVLSDIEKNSNKKAVMSLQEDDAGVRGTLRLYNFPSELSGVSSLGVNVNQKIYKAGLTFKSHMLYEFFINLKEIPNKFSCAVINFQNAEPKPILYGSSEGTVDDVYASIISEIGQDNSIENTKKVLDKFDIDFEKEERVQIEKQIDETLCQCDKDCANCVYKKFFFESKQNQEVAFQGVEKNRVEEELIKAPSLNEEAIPEEVPQSKEEDTHKEALFIDKLMPQINKLFEDHPLEENLQRLMPFSKWVKVDYEDDGDFYVFGLLYDENQNVQYVCYGVPAVFEEEPPKELSGYPIWLPFDKENREGFGYWLTYQDASTGEPVRAVID